MTAATVPLATVPRHALRRGTRGFAAVVLFLTAMTVLAAVVFALPSSGLDLLAVTWLVPLGLAYGLGHLVAVYGVIRRRAWVSPLTLYLAAIGIGVAAFGLLMIRAGLLAESSAAVAGLMVWLIGSWLVAARFVLAGMAPPALRTVDTPAVAAPAPAPVPAFGLPGRAGGGAMTLVRDGAR